MDSGARFKEGSNGGFGKSGNKSLVISIVSHWNHAFWKRTNSVQYFEALKESLRCCEALRALS